MGRDSPKNCERQGGRVEGWHIDPTGGDVIFIYESLRRPLTRGQDEKPPPIRRNDHCQPQGTSPCTVETRNPSDQPHFAWIVDAHRSGNGSNQIVECPKHVGVDGGISALPYNLTEASSVFQAENARCRAKPCTVLVILVTWREVGERYRARPCLPNASPDRIVGVNDESP